MAEDMVATSTDVQAGKKGTRAQERYVVPPVDIYETEHGLAVLADLPGVAKEGLSIRVEDGVLTIQGRTTPSAPGSMLHREYELVNYFRQFELSEKVDQTRIGATLKQGVLALDLPTAEAARPRQIQVNVG